MEWFSTTVRLDPRPVRTEQVVHALRGFWNADAPPGCTKLDDRVAELVAACGRYVDHVADGAAIHRAAQRAADQLGCSGEHVLLHGDAHLANFGVRPDDTVAALDPDGLIGDRCFDLARLSVVDHTRFGSTVDESLEHVAEVSGESAGRIARYATVIAAANSGYRRHMSNEAGDVERGDVLAAWVLTRPRLR